MKKDQLQQLLKSVPHPDTPDGSARLRELLISRGIDPASLAQNIEMTARYVDAHMDISFPGDAVSVHSHNFSEMVYCISGEADYAIGSDRIRVRRGDILAIPAGISHTPQIPAQTSDPYRRYVLWISQEFSQIISTMFLGESSVSRDAPVIIRTGGTSWEHLGQYFRRCVQECEQKQYRHDAVVFGITTELAVQLSRFLRAEHMDHPDKPSLVDQIVNYVEAHLSERITVADIAARFWVSQSTVSQLFRNKMGVSFYRYVTHRRLLESKLLIRSGVAMDQVSISVGFQDYSTFYRAFKSEFGISPSQFRKQL